MHLSNPKTPANRAACVFFFFSFFWVMGIGPSQASMITPEQKQNLVAVYSVMFNAAPSEATLAQMVSDSEEGQSLLQIAAGLDNASFRKEFPGFLLSSEIADKLVTRILGNSPDPAQKDFLNKNVINKLNAGLSTTDVIVKMTLAAAQAGALDLSALESSRTEHAVQETIYNTTQETTQQIIQGVLDNVPTGTETTPPVTGYDPSAW